MKKANNLFLNKPTLNLAKDLIGCYLLSNSKEGKVIGKIVETEAYLYNDPASHSFKGLTKRNSAMFEEAGTIYVYFIYGNYYCFNIVSNKKGIAEAVLIRALEPVSGFKLMKKRRGVQNIFQLCSGPAKLTMAFGITKEDNLKKINKSNINLYLKNNKNQKIISSERIGITNGKNLLHRFYLQDSEYVSKINNKHF